MPDIFLFCSFFESGIVWMGAALPLIAPRIDPAHCARPQ
jgi:hypothetical protein